MALTHGKSIANARIKGVNEKRLRRSVSAFVFGTLIAEDGQGAMFRSLSSRLM
jgi:hypothetical protein